MKLQFLWGLSNGAGTALELRLKEEKLKKGINYSTSGRALPVTLAGGAAGKDFSFAEHSGIKGGVGGKRPKKGREV